MLIFGIFGGRKTRSFKIWCKEWKVCKGEWDYTEVSEEPEIIMKNNDKQCLQKEMRELRNVECKTEKDFTKEQQVKVQEKYQQQHQQISMIVHDERENKPPQVNIEENNDALLGVVKTNQTITLKSFASAKVS